MDPHPLVAPLAKAVMAALPAASLPWTTLRDQITPPPNPKLGDLCIPCFLLAKELKKAPPQIAQELAPLLAEDPLVTGVQATGPYLNVRLNPGQAALRVARPWLTQETSPPPIAFEPVKDKVMVEFSQPNTHKAFHVGHLRNVCLGDALVRVLRARGHEVVAANYFGDVGTHIAKCLWGYEQLSAEELAQIPENGKGEWLGQLYARSSIALEDLKDAGESNPESKAAYEAARARMTELLHGIESRDPKIHALWDQTRKWSLDDFAEIYRWCQVNFDIDFFESQVDQSGLALVQEYLDKGVFVESEGAVGIVNDEIKHMPFFMLRKRDKTGLYSTKDLALARLKFEECEIDRSIYVVDVRQSDHFRHVFLTLKKMGFAQADACEHVPYEMVELPSGPMAGRKGNVILFYQLRTEILKALREGFFAKYEGDWSPEEIDSACHQVALGAIKYGMLSRDVNQKIVFDMPLWLKFEGNTGPYLQYAHARCASILRKADAAGHSLDPSWASMDDASAQQKLDLLQEPAEAKLLVTLAGMGAVIEQVANQLRPSVLCTYLFELAKAYSSFQSECHVLKSEGDLRQARLLLVAATQNALGYGLSLLGIPAPSRM